MKHLARTRTIAFLAAATAVAPFLLGAPPAAADDPPAVTTFWLVDADTDTRIAPLADYATIDLAFQPAALSVEVETNATTGSVVFEIEFAPVQTESDPPYALAGDAGGDFHAVPVLHDPGWITISATPYTGNGGTGTPGPEATRHLYRRVPDFVVSSTGDRHDATPGDGTCKPAPLGFTSAFAAASDKNVRLLDKLTVEQYQPLPLPPVEAQVRAHWELQRGITRQSVIDDIVAIPMGQRTGCTLRAAIEETNALAGAQTISVDGTAGTYALTKGQLVVTDDVNLYGHELPTVDAAGDSRVLSIDGGGGDILVNIDELDLANGKVDESVRGGVLWIERALLQLSDSVVRGGKANFGGGIYLQDGGDLTLTRGIVRDNEAGNPASFGGGGVTQRGGGIFNLEGNVTVRASAIVDNRAVRGGGLSNKGGLMRVENSSVLDNEAAEIGGGLENQDNGGEDAVLHLSFVTMTGNLAGTSPYADLEQRTGGGVYNTATAFMANSILAENTNYWWAGDDHNAPDCFSPAAHAFKSYRNNVVGVLNANCDVADYSSGTTAFMEHGTDDDPLDPGLGSRAASPRPYRSPLSSSVALDGGAGPDASLYPCPAGDGRDQPRPVGEGCDIGGVERQ